MSKKYSEKNHKSSGATKSSKKIGKKSNKFNKTKKIGATNKKKQTKATSENPEKIFNSICRIYNRKNKKNGTGFFLQITLENEIYYFLLTCSSIISEENSENKDSIILYFSSNGKEEKRCIKIEGRAHFTFFKPHYITLIEIVDSDNISKERFLYPDLNYKEAFTFYLNKNYYIAGFKNNKNKRFISSFDLKCIDFYKFDHNINKGPYSIGSLICSKDNFNAIGMSINNNRGVFIGKILDHLENIRKGIKVDYKINIYKGFFNHGLRHGRGTAFYIDGGLYEGDWINDSREGIGTMYYSNGNVYIGNWKNDRREGYGIFYFCKGGTYRGEFKNDIIDGFGRLETGNGYNNLFYLGTSIIADLDNPNFDVLEFLSYF